MLQEAAGRSAVALPIGAALLAAALALGALAFHKFTRRCRKPEQAVPEHDGGVDYSSLVDHLDLRPEQDAGALLAGCRVVISER